MERFSPNLSEPNIKISKEDPDILSHTHTEASDLKSNKDSNLKEYVGEFDSTAFYKTYSSINSGAKL